MHRRSIAYLAALSVVPLLGGCVQATRHSNTMIFGTNTSFGVKVGTTTAQVPTIIVGYDRQEAVIMPLVANTDDDGTFQKPCDVSADITVTNGEGPLVHPCLLAATNGASTDSYSVLASFGASFDASTQAGGNLGAKGGLAQYFATGIAAQILATKGGASVVAVGAAAQTAAANNTDNSIRDIFATQEQRGAGIKQLDAYQIFQKKLVASISALGDGDTVKFIAEFEKQAGISLLARTPPLCATTADCTAWIKNGAYQAGYATPGRDYDKALTATKI